MEKIKTSIVKLFLIISLLIIIIIGYFTYNLYENIETNNNKISDLNNQIDKLEIMINNLNSNNVKNTNTSTNNTTANTSDNIITYELQTHEYFSNASNVNKYFIDSESELNQFYEIYSDELDINKDYLYNNSIFIQVEQVGSGSTQMKLSSVTFDNNNVNFIIDKKYSEVGTTDMAFWYFVAIIPNEQLNNLDLSNWNKPSEVSISTKDTSNNINN